MLIANECSLCTCQVLVSIVHCDERTLNWHIDTLRLLQTTTYTVLSHIVVMRFSYGSWHANVN